LPDNCILNTANMQSETGFPSSHQLKSYVASKSRLKLAARAVKNHYFAVFLNSEMLPFLQCKPCYLTACNLAKFFGIDTTSIYITIKTRRLSVTEVSVAGWVWSTHAQSRKADLNWKL